MTTFIIVIDAGSPAERSDLTSYLKAKDARFWHWIDDMWIATGLPDSTTAEGLFVALSALPSLSTKTMIVMALDSPMKYFGRADTAAWKWLAETEHQIGQKQQPAKEDATTANAVNVDMVTAALANELGRAVHYHGGPTACFSAENDDFLYDVYTVRFAREHGDELKGEHFATITDTDANEYAVYRRAQATAPTE